MVAALRLAAKRICGAGGALERPPQGLLSAAKELTPRTSHGGSSLRRFSSSESPSPLNNNKHGAKCAVSIAESSTQVKDPASSSACPPKDDKQFLATVMKLTLGTAVFSVACLYVAAKYIINGPLLGRERPVKKNTGESSDSICFIK